MTQPRPAGRSVRVDVGGGTVAAADIADDGTAVIVQFHIGAGAMPYRIRHRLIETVFEAPEFSNNRIIKAALPLGDVELLEAMRRHCTDIRVRAAGATCLVDGESIPANLTLASGTG
jgi:hypothetical protein